MLRRVVALGVWLLIASAWVWAVPPEGVENPRRRDGSWITDQAHLISPAGQERINRRLNDLNARTGCEMAVVTIQDTDGQSPKAFATNLFNRWGIGQVGRNNGVLVLVVVARHRVEVEVGDGARTQLSDSDCAAILSSQVVPAFKRGQFEAGIEQGVSALATRLRQPGSTPGPAQAEPTYAGTPGPAEAEPTYAGTPGPATSSRSANLGELSTGTVVLLALGALMMASIPILLPVFLLVAVMRSGKSKGGGPGLLLPFLLFGLAAAVSFAMPPLLLVVIPTGVWLAVSRYRRYRARNCPRCGARLERLDELSDDAYLNPGEQREEQLGSVDYDIHLCRSCQYVDKGRWPAWISSYSQCSRCGHRTSSCVSNETLSSATNYSEGRGRRSYRCGHCNHAYSEEYTIARLSDNTDSSSSSGSSSSSDFGGGSSSGGGAGASW